MRVPLYLAGIVVGLVFLLRALARITGDENNRNSDTVYGKLPPDTTVGAYARRSKEIARGLDTQFAESMPESVQAKPSEPKEERPETRTGA